MVSADSTEGRLSRWRSLGCILIVLGACSVDVNRGDTVYSCENSSLCPGGKRCVEKVCVVPCTSDSCLSSESCVNLVCRPNPVGSEILNYSFDDYGVVSLVHDRSGNRFDGFYSQNSITAEAGKYGLGLRLSEEKLVSHIGIKVPYHSEFYSGNTVTIEAYILREGGMSEGTVYSDYVPEVGVEYSLEIAADDSLEFVTSEGCLEVLSFQSTAKVQMGVWQHVAVTWDGQNIRFYIDGVEAGSFASTAMPCAFDSQYIVGARGDTSKPFIGVVDEVKVSDYAKSAAQIVDSMEHDSLLDIGVCGDRLLENEACLAETLCCTDSCEISAGSSCGGTGVCNGEGACIIDGGRVSDGLMVLYEFDEGSGPTVSDTSGVKPALNLGIGSLDAVVWTKGGLRVLEAVTISNGVDTSKVVSPIAVGNEFSMEAWVSPANSVQEGPARIFTISADSSNRNVTLGQEAESYIVRIRSSETTSQGQPVMDSQRGDVVAGQKTHLLVTRSSDGLRRFYVNGVLRSETIIGGTLGVWANYPLSMANEFTGGRPWLGEFFLAAIYSRSLTPEEVSRNFSAGSEI